MVSDGQGEASSAFFIPDDSRILYSSTAQPAQIAMCPEPEKTDENEKLTTWRLNDGFQIYGTHTDETDTLPIEPGAPHAFNSETSVCEDGTVVFTSDRNGDPDLYTGKLDPQFGTISGVKQITFLPGYDGGAFFSPDCSRLVWTASRPHPGKAREKYQSLLAERRLRPDELEVWTANADGSHAHAVTQLGVTSFAPSFAPDGTIIFSSNVHAPDTAKFDLYLIHEDGTGLERVTYSEGYESFPMFSRDGKHLVFSSNRAHLDSTQTHILVADWVANAPATTVNPPRAEDRWSETARALSAAHSPTDKASFIEARMKELGLVPFKRPNYTSESDGNTVGALGSACARGSSPVVIEAADGADIASMLETARQLGSEKSGRKRCYVFAALTSENAFFEQLGETKVSPKSILALHQAGTLENNEMTVFGSGSASEWAKLIGEECDYARFNCTRDDGYDPNDRLPLKRVPILRFSGAPTVGEPHATGGVQLAEFVRAVARRVSDPRQSITYQKISPAPTPGKLGNHPAAIAYLGEISDDTPPPTPGRASDGVKLLGAVKGSPAEHAGLRKGDLLFAISLTDKLGNFIRNAVHDRAGLVRVLSQLLPDQPVLISVKRGDRTLDLPATLGKRTAPNP